MSSEEFAKALKEQGSDAAIRITLQNLQKPPGKRPKPEMVQRSEWFTRLSENEREMLGQTIREAAENAVFGVLAVLDGARVVEDSKEKGDFELYYTRGKDKTLLNDEARTPLHDLYNGLTVHGSA